VKVYVVHLVLFLLLLAPPARAEFAVVPLADLQTPSLPLDRPQGINHREVVVYRYEGREAFLKVTRNRSPTDPFLLHEAQFTRKLSELGIGPRFYGLVEKDGFWGLLTENVPGAHFSSLQEMRRTPELFGEATADSLVRIARVLEENRIHPDDLQLRVGLDGRARVVDPGLFTLRRPENEADARSYQRQLLEMADFARSAERGRCSGQFHRLAAP
jgi:hypothetical protein